MERRWIPLLAALTLALLLPTSAAYAAEYTAVVGGGGRVLAVCRLGLWNETGAAYLQGACSSVGTIYINYTVALLLGSCAKITVLSRVNGSWIVKAVDECSHDPRPYMLNLTALLGVPGLMNVSIPGCVFNGTGVERYNATLSLGNTSILFTATYTYESGMPSNVAATLTAEGKARIVLRASRPRSYRVGEAAARAVAALIVGALAGYMLVRLQEMLRGYPLYLSIIAWFLTELIVVIGFIRSAPLP